MDNFSRISNCLLINLLAIFRLPKLGCNWFNTEIVFLYYHGANFSEIYSVNIFFLPRKKTFSYGFRCFIFFPRGVLLGLTSHICRKSIFPNSPILCVFLTTVLTAINSPFEYDFLQWSLPLSNAYLYDQVTKCLVMLLKFLHSAYFQAPVRLLMD